MAEERLGPVRSRNFAVQTHQLHHVIRPGEALGHIETDLEAARSLFKAKIFHLRGQSAGIHRGHPNRSGRTSRLQEHLQGITSEGFGRLAVHRHEHLEAHLVQRLYALELEVTHTVARGAQRHIPLVASLIGTSDGFCEGALAFQQRQVHMVAHAFRRFRLFSRGTGTNHVPRIPVPFRIRKNRLQRPVVARCSLRQGLFRKSLLIILFILVQMEFIFLYKIRNIIEVRFRGKNHSLLAIRIDPDGLVCFDKRHAPVVRMFGTPLVKFKRISVIQPDIPAVGVSHQVPATIERPFNFVTGHRRIRTQRERPAAQGAIPEALFCLDIATAILLILPEITEGGRFIPPVEQRVAIEDNRIHLHIRKRKHLPSIAGHFDFGAHHERRIERNRINLIRKCRLQHIASRQQRILHPDMFIRSFLHFFGKAVVFQDISLGIHQRNLQLCRTFCVKFVRSNCQLHGVSGLCKFMDHQFKRIGIRFHRRFREVGRQHRIHQVRGQRVTIVEHKAIFPMHKILFFFLKLVFPFIANFNDQAI